MERSGIFYVRYYLTVEGKRKRFTARFGVKDHKHHSTTCAPVNRWRDEYMLKINLEASKPVVCEGPVGIQLDSLPT